MSTDITSTSTYGRRRIRSAQTVVTRENLGDVLADALPFHVLNASEIDYLYKYWRGDQPILDREKEVRSTINNRIVENHAAETVSFFSGYFLGEPVAYVNIGMKNTPEDIDSFNDIMRKCYKTTLDQELATWIFTGGVGYRIVLPSEDDETPLDIDVLDPRDTFIVYSTGIGRKPLMAVMSRVVEGNKYIYCGYTKTHYFEVDTDETRSASELLDSPYAPPISAYRIIKWEPHMLGGIPVVEYNSNSAMLGCFEAGISLLDAINIAASDRMNGIEQFVQAIMVLYNAEMDEDALEFLKNYGLVKIKSNGANPADLKYLTAELNQTQTQTLVDYMKETYKEVVGMPHPTKGMGGGSSGNVGSVILWQGWETCEARMKETEQLFKRSERRFIHMALKILGAEQQFSLDEDGIDVKTVRTQYNAMPAMAQSLQMMLQAGIEPSIAIARCGLFGDATDVAMRSAEYLEKWKPTFIAPSQNPIIVEEEKDNNDMEDAEDESGNAGDNQQASE